MNRSGRTTTRKWNFRWILTSTSLVWLFLYWKNLSSLRSITHGDIGDEKVPVAALLTSQTKTVGDDSSTNSHVWKSVNHTQWCRASDSSHPGLIYVKVPKTASSTLVGINMRIARKVGARTLPPSSSLSSFSSILVDAWSLFVTQQQQPQKVSWCTHTKHHGRQPLLERRKPALVWSFLRDPAKRAISDFYHFHVSRRRVIPSNPRLARFLQSQRNYQWDYLVDYDDPKATRPADDADNGATVSSLVQKYFLNAYNFIGLVERMDESLAVMKLLWNLDYEDLIVLSAKLSGQYDDGRSNAVCTKIQKPPTDGLSNHTKTFLANDFRKHNYDYDLYDIVNQTLDDTIQALGYGLVQQHVERLRFLQHFAEEQCQSKAVFPCSSNGTRQHELSGKDCYLYDSGCGFRCVDRVLEEIKGEE